MMPKTTVKRHSRKTKSGKTTVRKHTRRLPDIRKVPARTFHQARHVDDRVKDEKTTEEYKDKKEWASDPVKYDFPRVDDAIPEYMTFHWQGNELWLDAEGEDPDYTEEDAQRDYDEGEDLEDIHRQLGGTAGYLRYYDHSNAGYLHIDAMYTYRAYRHEGVSNILLRKMTNYADENKLDLTLNAHPFRIADFMESQDVVDYEGYVPEKQETLDLIEYYKQFGFKPTGKLKHTDGLYTQSMKRIPQEN